MDIEQHYLRSMLQQMREPPLEPVEGEGGAAFGVYPAMRSAASRTGEKSAAATMLPADVAAGFGKGLITGGVGMAGDIVSIFNGIRSIFARGGNQDVVEAFLQGLEEKTILPTSEDMDKFLTKYLGPVVPKDAPMAKERAGVAQAGQFAGEMVSGPGMLIKGGKAAAKTAVKTAKFIKPKVGEMLSDYMSRSGMTPELMAYHGTPYRFERFDASKIGSGEGSQAYGYGLYFAESPGVARSYQAMANNPARRQGGLTSEGRDLMVLDEIIKLNARRLTDGDVPKLAELIQKRPGAFQKPQEMLARISEYDGNFAPSYLYTVDIPDEMVGKMLDWDKPLSEQKNIIGKITPQSMGLKYSKLPNGNHAFLNTEGKIVGNSQIGGTPEGFEKNWMKDIMRGTGRDLYNNLNQALPSSGKKSASAALQSAGIPGIRYLDASSRGTSEGTRNIVVFPGGEDQVKIIKVE